jgi:hypothetical protein
MALRVLLALDAFFVVRGPYGAQRTMLDTTQKQLDSPEDRAPGPRGPRPRAPVPRPPGGGRR